MGAGPRTLDVHLEIDPFQLAKERDPTRWVAGQAHHTAKEAAHAKGARLRHAEPIEVHTAGAMNLSGQPVLLVVTRWIVDNVKET